MNQHSGSLMANIVDIPRRRIDAARMVWRGGTITALERSGPADPALPWLLPGFVDAHVHIESSIPELKLSDRGLFDGRHFCFTELQVKRDDGRDSISAQ